MTREEFGQYLLDHPPTIPPPIGTAAVYQSWINQQIQSNFGGGRLSRFANIALDDGRRLQVVVVDLGARRGYFFVDVTNVAPTAVPPDLTF